MGAGGDAPLPPTRTRYAPCTPYQYQVSTATLHSTGSPHLITRRASYERAYHATPGGANGPGMHSIQRQRPIIDIPSTTEPLHSKGLWVFASLCIRFTPEMRSKTCINASSTAYLCILIHNGKLSLNHLNRCRHDLPQPSHICRDHRRVDAVAYVDVDVGAFTG